MQHENKPVADRTADPGSYTEAYSRMTESLTPHPSYWLTVCNGFHTAQTLAAGTRTRGALEAIQEVLLHLEDHPLLGLPELPSVVAAFGETATGAEYAHECRELVVMLRHWREFLESVEPSTGVVLSTVCAHSLIDAETGQRAINLRRALDLMENCRTRLEPGSEDRGIVTLAEADASVSLADLDPSETTLIERAIQMYEEGRGIVGRAAQLYPQALAGEAHSRRLLAERGVAPSEQLEQALDLITAAKNLLGRDSDDWLAFYEEEDMIRSAITQLRSDGSSASTPVSQIDDPKALPTEYWMSVCGAEDAIRAIATACERNESPDVWGLFSEYPILVLPELVAALQERVNKVQSRSLFMTGVIVAGAQDRLRSRPEMSAACGELLSVAGSRLTLETSGNRKMNLMRGIGLIRESRSMLTGHPDRLFEGFVHEADARRELAALGWEQRADLENAVELYRQAAELAPGDDERGNCLASQALSSALLAALGYDVRANLHRALELIPKASAAFPVDSDDRSRLPVIEGLARRLLADLGMDPRQNLEEAERLYRSIRQDFDKSSVRYLEILNDEHAVHLELAGLGVEANHHLQAAYDIVGEIIQLDLPILDKRLRSHAIGSMFLNQGLLNLRLVRDAANERAWQLLKSALFCFQSARAMLEEVGDIQAANSLMGSANALCLAVEHGHGNESEIREAIDLMQRARALMQAGTGDHADTLVNEGRALGLLAKLGFDREQNILRAAQLIESGARTLIDNAFPARGVWAFQSLGQLGHEHSRPELAAKGFAAAVHAADSVRGGMHLLKDRQQWLEEVVYLYRGAVEAYLQLEDAPRALEFVERGRSRALGDLLSPLRNPPPHADEEFAAYRELITRAEDLDVRVDWSTSINIDRANDTQRRSEQLDIERLLRSEEARLRDLFPDAIQFATPFTADEYARLARELDEPIVVLWAGLNSGAAILVWPDGAIESVSLPSMSHADVQRWMYGSGNDAEGWLKIYLAYRKKEIGRSAWQAEIRRVLAELGVAVGEPLRRLLLARHARRVTVISSGYLSLLPLQAASWKDGTRDRHFIDDFDVTAAPSGWTMWRCRQRASKTPTAILVVSSPTRTDTETLPASRWEAESVAQLARRSRNVKCQHLSGAHATAGQVLAVVGAHSIVHFACHAGWNPHQALNSAVDLAMDTSLTLRELLHRPQSAGADLIVLSGCESAVGLQLATESDDYLGLPGGFIVSGVKSVVGSLWRVEDLATALIVGEFYKGVLSGDRLSSSLRSAQLWLRDLHGRELRQALDDLLQTSPDDHDLGRELASLLTSRGDKPFANPYYWAAFTLIGSSEPLPI
jgi:CHAT domain-containing protein/tetratricopeptide (TPR) repeat protein